MVQEHRERTYIRKDIIMRLTEHGELNQTKLLSYCGLNLSKHKQILDEMEKAGIISCIHEPWGSKTVVKYMVTEKGRQVYDMILEPYEKLFPRNKSDEEEHS